MEMQLANRISEVLTVADVAKILRCSKAHVCKIINGQVRGTAPIPVINLGRRKIVRIQSLMRWMNEHEGRC
jgi:Helix-turn-helix domain